MNPYVIIALCALFPADPDSVIRGIYINPYQANSKTYLENVFAQADSGLINTIVVDFKSDYGFLCYPSAIGLAKELNAVHRYLDVDYLVKNAQLHNLRLVARIVCFHDNYLAQYKNYGILDSLGNIWLDKKGIAWVNPYVPGVTDYLLKVVEEIVHLGIKSIAFDYIRFPTDGNLSVIRLTNVSGPRHQPIINFLKKVREKVDAEIGVCIFGYAVWYNMKFEGQDVAKFGPYVDVVYPMLYPSHFHPDFKKELNESWRNYWIYYDSVKEAFKKLPLNVKVVSFIQGFDLAADEFNHEYISTQISGALGANGDGFVIWNAGGNYATSWLPLSWARNLILKKCAQMNLDNHRKEVGHRYQDIPLP